MDKIYNYSTGGCWTCMFAQRDDRNRYIGPCSGYANCDYEEYKGPEPEMYEEDKDKYIQLLEKFVAGVFGEDGEEMTRNVLAELKGKATEAD